MKIDLKAKNTCASVLLMGLPDSKNGKSEYIIKLSKFWIKNNLCFLIESFSVLFILRQIETEENSYNS